MIRHAACGAQQRCGLCVPPPLARGEVSSKNNVAGRQPATDTEVGAAEGEHVLAGKRSILVRPRKGR